MESSDSQGMQLRSLIQLQTLFQLNPGQGGQLPGFQTGQGRSPFADFMNLASLALGGPIGQNQGVDPKMLLSALLFASLSNAMQGSQPYSPYGGGQYGGGQYGGGQYGGGRYDGSSPYAHPSLQFDPFGGGDPYGGGNPYGGGDPFSGGNPFGGGMPVSVDGLADQLLGSSKQWQSLADYIGGLQDLLGGDPGGQGMGMPPLSFLPQFQPNMTECLAEPTPMSDGDAISTLLENFDKLQSNGVVGKAELQKAADDESNPDLAAAAQHVLNNEALFQSLDTAFNTKRDGHDVADGLMSKGDLETANAQTNLPSEPGMNYDQAMRTLVENWNSVAGDDGLVSKDELEKTAKDMSNPELASAAQYLLDNQTALQGLDTANEHAQGKSAKPDSLISRDDVAATLQASGFTPAEGSVLQKMSDYKSQIFGAGGSINKGQIQEMADGGKMPNGKPTPPALAKAMEKLLDSPALLLRLGGPLGEISSSSFDKALSALGTKGTNSGGTDIYKLLGLDPSSGMGPGFGSGGSNPAALTFASNFFSALSQNFNTNSGSPQTYQIMLMAFNMFKEELTVH